MACYKCFLPIFSFIYSLSQLYWRDLNSRTNKHNTSPKLALALSSFVLWESIAGAALTAKKDKIKKDVPRRIEDGSLNGKTPDTNLALFLCSQVLVEVFFAKAFSLELQYKKNSLAHYLTKQ